MTQSKVNTDLENLGVNYTNIDINEDYATKHKSNSNSPLHGVGGK